MENNKIKLSPLTRLMVTFDRELALDDHQLFDERRYERLVAMLAVAERRRDRMLRTLLVLDALTVLFLTGKRVTLPLLGLALDEIPAAVQICSVLAALAFLFLATSQLGWHGYSAMADQIGRKRVIGTGIDPEFVLAADKFLEFAVKIYRVKMNIFGDDFFVPGRAYRILCKCFVGLILLTVISLFVIHLSIVVWSITHTVDGSGLTFLSLAYALFVVVANAGGLLLFLTLYHYFSFDVVTPTSTPET